MTIANTNRSTVQHDRVHIFEEGQGRYLCFFNHLPVRINGDQLEELKAQVKVEVIEPSQQDETVNQLQRISAQAWEGWEYPFSQTNGDTAKQEKWLHQANLVKAWHGIDIAQHGVLADFEKQYFEEIGKQLCKCENLPPSERGQAMEKIIGKPAELIAQKLEDCNRLWPDLCGYPLDQVASFFQEWAQEYHEELEEKEYVDPNNLALTEMPPEIASSCPNIMHINLEHNRLSTLPKEIGDLSKLEMIELRDNEIAYFPPSVASLRACKVLTMYNNNSKVFPLNIELFPALETLEICGRFAYIPPRIFQLKTLKRLFIKPARSDQGAEISENVGNLQQLEKLTIYHARNVPNSIGKLARLQELSFDNGKIDSIPETLKNLKNLKQLKITNLHGHRNIRRPDWLREMDPNLKTYLTLEDFQREL